MKANESGQAFVGGIILLLIMLFFVIYFLYVSESFLRFFSNAEQANLETVEKVSQYAHVLNEISLNNQNILVSLATAQNALIKSLEYGIYIGFHQPYWVTYSMTHELSFPQKTISTDTESILLKVFNSFSLSSARGYFIAQSLAEKNNKLLIKLPLNIRQNFSQISNHQTLCYALETQKKYYESPGILKLPVLKIYQFYIQREIKNRCSIEHKVSFINKFRELSLPVFYSMEKNRILDYSQLDYLNTYDTPNYGILIVNLNKKDQFLSSLNFSSPNRVKKINNKFFEFDKYLSKLIFFHEAKLGDEKNLLKSPLKNEFIMTHKLIYCPSNLKCSITNENFLESFFFPHWTVSGVFK